MSPKLLNTLIAVLSFAVYYIFIGPLWTGQGTVLQLQDGGVKSLMASQIRYNNTVEQADKLSKQGEEFSKQYESIGEDIKEKMKIMVPSKTDKIVLLNELDNIANYAGIAITNVTVSEDSTTDKLKGSYNITFNAKTTYTKFKEFMRNYENSLRLFTLDSVNFAAPTKTDDLIDFKVSLKTYYLK